MRWRDHVGQWDHVGRKDHMDYGGPRDHFLLSLEGEVKSVLTAWNNLRI